MRDVFTDEQVEAEIERLNSSELVRLARAEQRAKYRRRQYMYQLRYMEKRGAELTERGFTEEYFNGLNRLEGGTCEQ